MNNYGLSTPPSTPPPHQQHSPRCHPPTPESRIGIFLGQSLELVGILGTGAYGVVYSAVDHTTGIYYAVKALSKTNANGEPLDRRQREFQQREIQLHYAASRHPNIVSMLKILDDKDCIYVVLEYCREGDLFSNITEKGRYISNDTLVKRTFLQILDAVEHCHRLGIYHRDLKPENILVSNAGQDVHLADFGLATMESVSEDHGCGSTFYMSPECLDQSSRSQSYLCAPNDIWSLGVILVNLTCGRNPWKQASMEDSTYRAFVNNPKFLRTILPLSEELNQILGMIFTRNPEERITVSELKRRILDCSCFSGPLVTHLPSPPSSPSTSSQGFYFSQGDSIPDSPVSSVSDDGSIGESCSTFSDVDISDVEDFDCGSDDFQTQDDSDSSYGSMDEGERPTPEIKRPAAPFPHQQQYQQYVLPPQDPYAHRGQMPTKVLVPNPYVAHHYPWMQSWVSTGYPSVPAPQVYYPAPYPHAHYPSSFQYARDGFYR